MAALNIGSQIKHLRNQRGLTLQEVSEVTGLSKPHLSQIENDLVSPPIATLLKISTALGVKISYFFQSSPTENRIVVVRKEDRYHVKHGSSVRELSDTVYNYELLAYPMVNKYMEPFIVEMKPRDVADLPYNNHRGEEFVFLLEGQMEFRCADQIIILNEGDSLYFDSGLPHAYRGIGGVAKLIAVLFSPA